MDQATAPAKKERANPRADADVRHGASQSPFYSVEQFARRNPVFTEKSLRWLIFKSAENGLDASGALLRNGRAIVIDEPAFFEWFRAQGRKAA